MYQHKSQRMMFTTKEQKLESEQYDLLGRAAVAGIRKILKHLRYEVRRDLTQEALMRLLSRGETDTTSAYNAGMTVAGRWLKDKALVEQPISQIAVYDEEGKEPEDPWEPFLKEEDTGAVGESKLGTAARAAMKHLSQLDPCGHAWMLAYMYDQGVRHTKAEYARADALRKRLRRLCLQQMS